MTKSKTVLIAGGSGLIGTVLQERLIALGYQVKLLGRKKTIHKNTQSYIWNPTTGELDQNALINTDYVVNLAGSNVGKGKWTKARKADLISSRTLSTKLLVDSILQNKYPIQKFIQASAIGYYGFTELDVAFSEKDKAGNDFLAQLTLAWENELNPLENSNTPVLILRIGVVLSNHSGALVELTKPIRMNFGTALGSGKQIVPWIHIDDLISIMIAGIKDTSFNGVYNAVSPHPISNKDLTQLIAQTLKKPFWPIRIPSFILRLLLGEQAQIVLTGNKVSPQKLIQNGFQFQHPHLEQALANLLK